MQMQGDSNGKMVVKKEGMEREKPVTFAEGEGVLGQVVLVTGGGDRSSFEC